MKLLTAIKRQPVDNCIILTYNADLLFFEHLVFGPLYAAGCRNTLVVCDPAQYAAALDDMNQVRYAGQRYALLPGRTSPRGVFHPKLILLTSADQGRLFVTSGNLTKAGYTRNWEVASLFEFDPRRPDPTSWAACQWAYETLSQIIEKSDTDGIGTERLEQMKGTTSWLRQEFSGSHAAIVWPLSNLVLPLMDQLENYYQERDGSCVQEAVVVSPFLDRGAHAIDHLLTSLTPKRLQIYTRKDTHGLNPPSLASVLEKHSTEVQIYHLALDRRWLHAKTLLLRTERGAWLVSGSANFSRPAWLCSAPTGNTEAVVIRYEDNAKYFDAWLHELTTNAYPLSLDWETETPGVGPDLWPVKPQINLLAALIRGRELRLSLAQPLPADGVLNLELVGEVTSTIAEAEWKQDADHTVRIRIPSHILSRLLGPSRVAIDCLSTGGEMSSNPVLVHNTSVLKRFSQPVKRRDRPKVPDGMVPGSYEDCAMLLDMLLDLLATNAEQLAHHGKRIVARATSGRQEDQMVLEEEDEQYDPEAHFVEERVETTVVATTSELYDDFYDRLTYEEVLRAALSAVYHPAPDDTIAARQDDEEDSSTASSELPGAQPDVTMLPPSQGDVDLRARIAARIENGFKRLVGNFVEGTRDAEYMAHIPPPYHLELFVIITTYLRVVWRDGMLSKGLFADLSLELLAAFWGIPQLPGAWQALVPRMEDVAPMLEKRLQTEAQTWLYVYSVAEILCSDQDRRVYDLAAWMRYWNHNLCTDPGMLITLREDLYRRLWRISFPEDVVHIPAGKVVARLGHVREWYDEQSLRDEIAAWPGARASLCHFRFRGRKVPQLSVKMPLDDSQLDPCWYAFTLFVTWPRPKPMARACFTNANPADQPDDVRRIIIFYRGDIHSLTFAVERQRNRYQPDLDVPGILPTDLSRINTVDELLAHNSANQNHRGRAS